ncbi:carbohydrate-binding protein [Pontibacter qinzhouensis]|uniref:Carbohydrate-binding protein n=1 Tax=Pontibacter qinzhouensis TaxID=2603253 RepID=A0A5C8KF06_9BACT|nr:PQQ-dependent sugar dehydrogenase [Pontibacter qinzhouensis]TXK52110.1 carbohydrate-binding protein [Pontibacter qinzhouensis]
MKSVHVTVATVQRCLVFLMVACLFACAQKEQQQKMLVLHTADKSRLEQTQLYLHAILEQAEQQSVLVEISDDPAVLHTANLQQYGAVVFLNLPQLALSQEQQKSFKSYLEQGGGFIGIASEPTAATNWHWYASLYSTAGEHAKPDVLLTAANSPGAPAAGLFRSFVYSGGRVSVLAAGLREAAVQAPGFTDQLAEAIRFTLGATSAESRHLQELSRYHYAVLNDDLKEPMELSIASNGLVLVIEREGSIFQFDPISNKTKKIATLPVDATESGHGLQGIAIDPEFEKNKQVYFFYTPPKSRGAVMYVSRFTMVADGLDLASEKVLLKVPLEINQSGHLGGSLSFDAKGNLYISTGDNSVALHSGGYAPIDERPGHTYNDAQRSAANTHDLRGKILRITPLPNGSYAIPDDNLFPKDGSQGKPEIYVMGCRNPFRIAVDKPSGILYWGEVGPDAGKDSTRGSQGYDEINQVREACNNGWPYFIGDNYPYAAHDFATGKTGAMFNPAAPENHSINNTGATKLPAAAPAFIYYPYAPSKDFPELGEGARCALGGPVYHYDAASTSGIKFPEYYDKVLFIGDWSRNWIKAVYMDENHDYVRTEAFMPKVAFDNPIDMEFGPDGALYVLEFGDPWGMLKKGGKLARIEYNKGNRPPVAVASASQTIGGVPLTVQFSSKGSFDHDKGDALRIQWTLNGKPFGQSAPDPAFTFTKPGQYMAVLTVTDKKGMSSQRAIKLKIGNAAPVVNIASAANQSFYWQKGQPFDYQVTVTDPEDKAIDRAALIVSMDYLPQGNDVPGLLMEGQQLGDAGAVAANELISKNDCMSCHTLDHKAIGPAFLEVAKKYKLTDANVTKLASKVIQGGGGAWGDVSMNAHPKLTQQEATAMVRYIISLNKPAPKIRSLPTSGSLVLNRHEDGGTDGKYLFRAAYTDKGGPKVDPLTGTAEIVLRHPHIEVLGFDAYQGIAKVMAGEGAPYLGQIDHGDYLLLQQVDLKTVEQLTLSFAAHNTAGYIEVRAGSVKGSVIGQAEFKPTGSWSTWKTVPVAIEAVPGKQDLYLVFRGHSNLKDNLLRLRWVEFQQKKTSKGYMAAVATH